MKKELKKIVRSLEEQGFDCEVLPGGHVGVRKDGRRVTTFAGSPSDHRSWKNSRMHAKRAGWIPPDAKRRGG